MTGADWWEADPGLAAIVAADEADQRAADRAERRKNGPASAGPRPRVKGSRKHCSTHPEYRSDCYRCHTEGTF